ncbi:general transcription factor 3C polypeptide 5 (transcription factor C subunit 1), partial [Phenoliferia sp. Uapishka_3]
MDGQLEPQLPSSSSAAPLYPIPYSESHNFVGIEYPGPVKNVSRALKSMGGLDHISRTLIAPPGPALAIELNLNGSNKFHHPVQAGVLDSGNVVMKVVKRRRKRPKVDESGQEIDAGFYTIEAIGVASKTVRFRGMADFQYNPKGFSSDPVVGVADALRRMDVSAIQNFSFPTPDESYTEEQYLPPPVFSRQSVPQMWEYKAVPATAPTVSVRPSGEEVNRLINMSRWKGRPMMTIAFADPDVPTGPSDELVKLRKPLTDVTEKALRLLLEKRPVWTRIGLLNELPPEDARAATNHKHIVSLAAFSFSDGPFRDLVIRFGYDPRKDSAARLREHLFDGKTAHGKVANFQLCDISDHLIQSLIQSSDGLQSSCSPDPEGWYDRDYFEQMRNVIRRKFLGSLNGVVISDTDCADLLGDPKAFWVSGPKSARKDKRAESVTSRSRSRGGSDDGSIEDDEEEEKESASEAGDEETKGTSKRKRRPKVFKVGSARAPWEPLGKKKPARAKQPARGETAEEKVSHLAHDGWDTG